MNKENQIILYQDDNEITRVSVRFADEDLWLTQGQLVEIYQTSKSNVSEHIKHIFEDGELAKEATVRKFNISYIQAIEKAEKEFEIYRKHEMELLESDFDKEIKRLKNKNDNSSK